MPRRLIAFRGGRLAAYELVCATLTHTRSAGPRLGPLAWTRFALVALSLAALIVACGSPSGTNSLAETRTATPFPSPTRSPEPYPGPSYPLTGRVVRLIPGGMVVDSAGREVEVSFSDIVDVWKETSVAASAIEVGDVLFIGGGHVWAKGGCIGGVILPVVANGLLVAVCG